MALKKILIIDDEPSIINFIVDVANLIAFEPKFLMESKKAVATAKLWEPDIICLDILMPSPDGIEILTQLKADPETAPIPVLILTAVNLTPEIKKKLSAAQAIFPKPIDVKSFIAKLRDLEPIPS